MSIEDAMKEQADASRELAAAMREYAATIKQYSKEIVSAASGSATTKEESDAPAADKPAGRGRPKKDDKKSAPAPEPEPQDEDEDDDLGLDDEPEEEEKTTLEDVKNIIKAVRDGDGGKEAALGLLKKFGATKLTDLDEGNYAALVAAGKKLV